MNKDLVKIEKYKGIDIFYDKCGGRLKFNFEGEREVNYLFEAQRIIDEPVWEVCNLEGYHIDGTFGDFIGTANADKKNIKSGDPLWRFKGKYDLDFKSPSYSSKPKVYLKNAHNDEVYREFKIQQEVVFREKGKLKVIIDKLKKD